MTTAVDTDSMDRLLAIAHQPIMETEAGRFILDLLPESWEQVEDLPEPDEATAAWVRSMEIRCTCGYRAPSHAVGLGSHISRAITQGLEGRIELP